MSIFRPPASPQVIQVGLALFLTGASGPVVPAGVPAQSSQSQAVVAYRAATSLAAQPAQASIVAMLPAAAVAPQQLAPVLPQPWPHAAVITARPTVAGALFGTAAAYLQASPVLRVTQALWPYAATILGVPTASPWGIAESELIFDRLQPPIPQQAPAWPHVATMASRPTASVFGAVSTYLRAPGVTVLSSAAWPHAAMQPAEPLPIIAAAPQIARTPPAVVSSSPAWTYLSAMLDQSASQWSIPPADLVFDRLRPAIVPAVPWSYVSALLVDTAPIADVVAQVSPARVTVPAATSWPSYTMLSAPSASQWSIPPADLVFDRLRPTILPVASWSYLTAQPTDTTPIIAAAAQVLPAPVALPSPQTWPYATTMLDTPAAAQWGIAEAAGLVFDRLMPTIVPAQPWSYTVAIGLGTDTVAVPSLGVQIPPSPVLQWLVQPLYSYAATFSPAPTLAGLLAPVPYWTWALPVNPVRAAEWPHASVRLPQPLPIIAQAQGQVPPTPAPQFVSQPWAYLLASPVAGPAATIPALAQMPAPQTVQQVGAQAPFVIKARDFANVIALIGPQAPPQPVRQWATQPPWSYSVVATLYPGPATLLAPPFVVGNTEVWHVEPRPRDWAVEPRPRFWAVQDH